MLCPAQGITAISGTILSIIASLTVRQPECQDKSNPYAGGTHGTPVSTPDWIGFDRFNPGHARALRYMRQRGTQSHAPRSEDVPIDSHGGLGVAAPDDGACNNQLQLDAPVE